MVTCLGSIDSEIRLAAAKLVSVLAKDAFYSKSIVFPEAALTTTVEGGYTEGRGLLSLWAYVMMTTASWGRSVGPEPA